MEELVERGKYLGWNRFGDTTRMVRGIYVNLAM